MNTVVAQPIAGVSARVESEVMTVYPSIGASGLGHLLGTLYESIPIGNRQIKLSHLLFPLPTAPLATLLYFWMKLFGERYMLTNRSLKIWSSMGDHLIKEIDLQTIGDVVVNQRAGHVFFKCADLQLTDQAGKPLLTLAAVPYANVFRQTILKASEAVIHVQSSLATIDARQT